MEARDDGTRSTSHKKSLSSQRFGAQVVNQVAWTPSRKKYESDPFFMKSVTYSWACYGSNQIMSECCHLREDDQLVRARNRIYETEFGKMATTEGRCITRTVTSQRL